MALLATQKYIVTSFNLLLAHLQRQDRDALSEEEISEILLKMAEMYAVAQQREHPPAWRGDLDSGQICS